MHANRKIHHAKKNTRLQVIQQQSFKAQQISGYRHTRKTSGIFLRSHTGVDFNFRNNFSNLGSFVKVSVESTIHC